MSDWITDAESCACLMRDAYCLGAGMAPDGTHGGLAAPRAPGPSLKRQAYVESRQVARAMSTST